MQCWNCGFLDDSLDFGKLSFRAVCEKCNAALHCCCNCKYYKPGACNDCLIPDTERIVDRTLNNFCEDFVLLGKAPDPNLKKEDLKLRFENLFKT